MSFLDDVVVRCTEIEQLLRALGGTGSGLAELLESLEVFLEPRTVEGVRRLASVRNKLVHEHGYQYPESQVQLLDGADAVLAQLRIRAREHAALPQSPAARLRDSTKQEEVAVPKSPWVQIITAETQPRLLRLKFPSSPARRLVFFRGNIPEVPPLGSHPVPLFGVSKLALVSMSPAILTLERTIDTRDQIQLSVSAELAARVRPTEEAIARIAADASNDTGIEYSLLEAQATQCLQRLLADVDFEELPRTDTLQSRFQELLREGRDDVDRALLVDAVTLRSVAPANPELAAHQVELLRFKKRAAIRLAEEAADRRRLEVERENLSWQVKHSQDLRESDREHAKKVALDQDEAEAARHKREMERLQMELQAKIKLAEIARDGEVAKAMRASVDQLMPMVIKGAMGEGERRTLADIVRKQIGLTVGLSSIDSNDTAIPPPAPEQPSTPEAPTDDTKQ